MGWIDLIRFAGQNLWRRRARTLLTTLGVVIGTVCIILLVAIGLSSYRQFEKYFLNSASLTEIQVYAGAGEGQNTKLSDETLSSVLLMEGVEAVTPVLRLPMFIDAGEYQANLNVTAMDRAYIAESLKLEQGRLFADSEMPELVVGYYQKSEFVKPGETPDYEAIYNNYSEEGGQEEPVITLPFDFEAQQLKLYLGYNPEEPMMGNDMPASKRYPGTITGTLIKTQNESDYNTYMSLSAAKRIIQQNRKLAEMVGAQTGSYTEMRIRAKDIDSVSKIVDALSQMGFEAYSEGEMLESAKEQQASQQSQLMLIGGISLFVSAIGIANTMLTSILERRKEIGIMKVTGLALKKIRRMFLIEASVIGLSGGAIGVVLSYIVSFVMNNAAGGTVILGMYLEEGMVLSIPLWLAFAGMGIAVLVGVLAGIYPAWKATKMSPLEAIRGA